VIELEIPVELVLEAERHSVNRMSYEYDRFGFKDNQRMTMILIGTIGQLILKKYLEENKIVFDFEYQAGQYDEMDFSINNEIVEVKTSGYGQGGFNRLNLLYSEDQFRAGLNKNFAYCVQIFINGYNRQAKILDKELCDSATIAGYMPFSDIGNFWQKRRFYGDDYKVPLNKLININNLIGIDL